MQHSSILGIFFLVVAVLPAQQAEIEPNDTPGLAQPVSTGSQVECSLTAGEEDWFSFTLANSGNVAMFLSANTNLDTVMELYDPTGAVLLGYSDDARDYLSDITINLAANTYLLKVRGYGPGTTGSYTLDIAARPSKVFSVVGIEPNDALPQAHPLTVSNCPETVDAELSGPGDEDWYQLTLTAPRSGVWVTIGEGRAPWITQHRYEFRDGAGNLLNAPTMGATAGNNSLSSQRTDQLRCWPNGTYYIVVKNRSPVVGTPAMTWPGNYRLTVEVLPMNTNTTPATETPEPNDLFDSTTAAAIVPGQRGFGNLGAGDVDYWGPITADGATTLIVQTAPGASIALGDSTLQLVDSRGNALADSRGNVIPATNGGNLLDGAAHARLFATLNTSDNYYVKVTGGTGPGNVGNYVIEIGLVPCSPYVAASNYKKVNNSSCPGSASGVTVLLSTPNAWELPVTGSLYVREVQFMQPTMPGVLLQGFTDIVPIDLSFLGAFGCTLDVDPLVVSSFVANGFGSAQLPMMIPSSPAVLGATIHAQVMALDPFAIPGGFTMSNSFVLTVGDHAF